METITPKEAKDIGYDYPVFNGFCNRTFIKGSWTLKDFIRDGVDFAVVQKGKKLNVFRREVDFIMKLEKQNG